MANGLATVLHDQIGRFGTALTGFQNLMGQALVTNLQSYATAEAAYQKAVANQKASEAAARAVALGTAQAEFEAAYAAAKADWIASLETNYVSYVVGLAQSEATYSDTLTGKLAWLDNQYADHHVTYVSGVAPLESAHWADTANRLRTYANAYQGRHRGYFKDFVDAEYDHAWETMGVGGQQVVDNEAAQKDYQVALRQGAPDAQTNLGVAMTDATQAFDLGQMNKDLDWTTTVADKDQSFRTGQATDDKLFSTDLTGYDRTFWQGRAGHVKTRDDTDAGSLKTFWNDEASAASTRFLAQATARADFWNAQYNAAATALSTFAGTLGTPWAQFVADKSVAKRDWWWDGLTGQKTDYLQWATDVNAEAEQYQTNVGNKFATELANITQADVEWWTKFTDALYTYTSDTMTSWETYVHGIAPQIKNYHVSVATAGRDQVEQGESFDHDAAVDAAILAYGRPEVISRGDHKITQAGAARDLVDRIEGDDTVGLGQGGANKKWQAAVDAAIEALGVYEEQEYAQLEADLAALDAAYRTNESRSWADALAALAVSHPTPWADHAASEADAEADLIAVEATEETTLETAEVNAERDYEIARLGAEKTLSSATTSARGVRAFDTAARAVTRAQEEKTAQVNLSNHSGTTGGSFAGITAIPEMMATAVRSPTSITAAAISLYDAVSYASGAWGSIAGMFGVTETVGDEDGVIDLDPYGVMAGIGDFLRFGLFQPLQPNEPQEEDHLDLPKWIRDGAAQVGELLAGAALCVDKFIRGVEAQSQVEQIPGLEGQDADGGKMIVVAVSPSLVQSIRATEHKRILNGAAGPLTPEQQAQFKKQVLSAVLLKNMEAEVAQREAEHAAWKARMERDMMFKLMRIPEDERDMSYADFVFRVYLPFLATWNGAQARADHLDDKALGHRDVITPVNVGYWHGGTGTINKVGLPPKLQRFYLRQAFDIHDPVNVVTGPEALTSYSVFDLKRVELMYRLAQQDLSWEECWQHELAMNGVRVAGGAIMLAGGTAEIAAGVVLIIPSYGTSAYLIVDGASLGLSGVDTLIAGELSRTLGVESVDFVGYAWDAGSEWAFDTPVPGRVGRLVLPAAFAFVRLPNGAVVTAPNRVVGEIDGTLVIGKQGGISNPATKWRTGDHVLRLNKPFTWAENKKLLLEAMERGRAIRDLHPFRNTGFLGKEHTLLRKHGWVPKKIGDDWFWVK